MTATVTGSTFEHQLGANGRFVARLRAGDLTIRGVDGDTARIRAEAGQDLAQQVRIHAAPGELELEPASSTSLGFVLAVGSHRFGSGIGNLEIDLPRGTAVSIETASGEIEVDGIHGSGRYRSTSGSISLTGVRGVLDVSAVSGDVRIDADGEIGVQLRTVSGDARVRAPRIGRLGVNTVSGEVRVDSDLGGGGPFSIETLSGDAVVVAHRGLRVDARTITGELHSDLDARSQEGGGRRSLTVGDGATTLTFKSVSGGLRIAAPREAHPAPEAEPGERETAAEPGAVDPRLEVLRALERGELGVDEATARLAEIDDLEAVQ